MAFYRFSLPSRVLGFPVEMQALIPEEIQDIPTLWMLHGANSDCTEWFAQTSLQRYLQGRGLAVVTVSVHHGFYVNMQHGPAYATYLEEEWIPAVRSVFPCLSTRREDNFLAGASMGGFGAFRLAMNRPDLFCKAGAFAGSIEMPTIVERNQRGIQTGGKDFLWAFGGYEHMINNKNDVIFMARHCAAAGTLPKLYMVCGTEDFGYALNTIARDDLRMAGAEVSWRQCPGIHSWDCWDPELPRFLDWLQDREVSE